MSSGPITSLPKENLLPCLNKHQQILKVIDAPQAKIINLGIDASETFENVGNPLQSSQVPKV
jgi:hypothetical protein